MNTIKTFNVVVTGKRELADDVVEFRFAYRTGAELPNWEPGAHIDVHIAEGIIRQYSLCGKPDDRAQWTIAVLREKQSRGGSKRLVEDINVGDEITVSEPRNHFSLIENSPRYLFIAGGIGITPIIPMIEQVSQGGRPWRLLYGGRTRASMAYLPELSAYAHRVTPHPQDEHGLLDLARAVSDAGPGTHVYCCGPEPLLAALEVTMKSANRPAEELHVERFSAPKVVNESENHVFEVVFAKSGFTKTVGPNETILSVAEQAGLEVSTACREGTCGSCETRVIDGEVDHRDWILTEDERANAGVMMVCVSRCRGKRLVLDI
ncbi:PDR/VanB family oxidoreductase [Paraburkholderia caribensis]|uniref:PDR/VanB family oxidoreductase n=1 Tax=Paraburkholderia caribensis TaxID=75105 RepID=UPI001CB3CD34|nr:PDR/VanB family oxidoreductase [Paraburkholderia caribensis]CAG9269664.1 Flavodoxin reductases (ferredoxin-NADPH reductases) family 1; Vanillate O-demethylase oxidoreductase [Paraburkholderia caribensis]